MFAGDYQPTVRLRFTGDGQKTKIGTVMAVCSVLKEAVYKPDHEYTACLYNGKFPHCISFRHLTLYCPAFISCSVPSFLDSVYVYFVHNYLWII